MKQRDAVRVVGHTLFTQFAATGETRRVVAIDLRTGATLRLARCEGEGLGAMELCCDLHASGSALVLEVFAAERIAQAAFDLVQAAMVRGMARRRAVDALRGLVRYVAIPVGVLLIGLAMNVAVHPEFGRSAAIAGPVAASLPMLPPPAPVTAASSGPSSAQIAKALSQGVASNKYTVQLGSGEKGTLFVFEDPLCPHCQEFAPELEKLAKDHTVYVFPVSVIGAEASAKQAAAVLCEADTSKRREAWHTAETTGLPTEKIEQRCLQAVSANDDIFHVMGLQGTPTLISGNGQVMPYDVPAEASAVAAWLARAN